MTKSTELQAFIRQKDGYKVCKNFLVYFCFSLLKRTQSPEKLS